MSSFFLVFTHTVFCFLRDVFVQREEGRGEQENVMFVQNITTISSGDQGFVCHMYMYVCLFVHVYEGQSPGHNPIAHSGS